MVHSKNWKSCNEKLDFSIIMIMVMELFVNLKFTLSFNSMCLMWNFNGSVRENRGRNTQQIMKITAIKDQI